MVVYEFARVCSQLSSLVERLAAELSHDDARREIHTTLGNQKQLRKECEDIKSRLRDGRNKVGTHLFVGDDTKWEEVSKIYGSIDNIEVEESWATLQEWFCQLENLVDGLENKGYAMPSSQPKHVSVTRDNVEWK